MDQPDGGAHAPTLHERITALLATTITGDTLPKLVSGWHPDEQAALDTAPSTRAGLDRAAQVRIERLAAEIVAAHEAQDPLVGSIVTDYDVLAGLPEGTLVTVVDDSWHGHGEVYERFSAGGRDGGQWLALDPSDRMDGEETVSSHYLILTASRRGLTDGFIRILHIPSDAYQPPEAPKPIALDASTLTPGVTVTLQCGRVRRTGVVETVRQHFDGPLVTFVGDESELLVKVWPLVAIDLPSAT